MSDQKIIGCFGGEGKLGTLSEAIDIIKTKKNVDNDERKTPEYIQKCLKFKKTLECIIKEAVDVNIFHYHYHTYTKKLKKGTITVDLLLRRRCEVGNEDWKTLTFIVTEDARTNIFNTLIIDRSGAYVKVLFSSFGSDPSEKLEIYVPRIIQSTLESIA